MHHTCERQETWERYACSKYHEDTKGRKDGKHLLAQVQIIKTCLTWSCTIQMKHGKHGKDMLGQNITQSLKVEKMGKILCMKFKKLKLVHAL